MCVRMWRHRAATRRQPAAGSRPRTRRQYWSIFPCAYWWSLRLRHRPSIVTCYRSNAIQSPALIPFNTSKLQLEIIRLSIVRKLFRSNSLTLESQHRLSHASRMRRGCGHTQHNNRICDSRNCIDTRFTPLHNIFPFPGFAGRSFLLEISSPL